MEDADAAEFEEVGEDLLSGCLGQPKDEGIVGLNVKEELLLLLKNKFEVLFVLLWVF